MGKHVDTTRYTDDTENPYGGPLGVHRKPGPAAYSHADAAQYATMRDVWSGNPDTDRAWRVPDYNMYG